jgi:hypothetical protein
VNPLLAGIALLVVASAIVAASAREPRLVVVAIALTLVLGPLLADPIPDPLGIAARLVGSILAVYLLWMAVRDPHHEGTGAGPARTEGSRIGWPAEVLLAAAAAIVGWSSHGLGAPAGGPAMASAAGFAVAALAVAPLLAGRDVLRLAAGMFLLLQAALIVRAGLGGTPTPLEQLITAGLLIALGGTLAALARSARGDGSDSFDLDGANPTPRRRAPDARPRPPGPPPPIRAH